MFKRRTTGHYVQFSFWWTNRAWWNSGLRFRQNFVRQVCLIILETLNRFTFFSLQGGKYIIWYYYSVEQRHISLRRSHIVIPN